MHLVDVMWGQGQWETMDMNYETGTDTLTDGQTCSSSIRLCNTSRLLLLNWWKPWEGMAWANGRTGQEGGKQEGREGKIKVSGQHAEESDEIPSALDKPWGVSGDTVQVNVNAETLHFISTLIHRDNIQALIMDPDFILHSRHQMSHLWGELSSIFQPGELWGGRTCRSAVQPQGFPFTDVGTLRTDLDLGLSANTTGGVS